MITPMPTIIGRVCLRSTSGAIRYAEAVTFVNHALLAVVARDFTCRRVQPFAGDCRESKCRIGSDCRMEAKCRMGSKYRIGKQGVVLGGRV